MVEHGTSAVERVHSATAARPFDVLDHVPPIAPAARGVRIIHDATVAGVYETIRQVNRLVGVTLLGGDRSLRRGRAATSRRKTRRARGRSARSRAGARRTRAVTGPAGGHGHAGETRG